MVILAVFSALNVKAQVDQKHAGTELNDLVGRYVPTLADVKETLIYDVSVAQNELWVKPSNVGREKLIRQSKDHFLAASAKVVLSFQRDEKGNVIGFSMPYFDSAGNAKILTLKKIELPAPSLKGNVTFKLKGEPDAHVVALAGSFNNWRQSELLFSKEGNEWICRVDLQPGRYTYKFVVDGNWIVDPENPEKEHDRNGYVNSVLIVKQ